MTNLNQKNGTARNFAVPFYKIGPSVTTLSFMIDPSITPLDPQAS